MLGKYGSVSLMYSERMERHDQTLPVDCPLFLSRFNSPSVHLAPYILSLSLRAIKYSLSIEHWFSRPCCATTAAFQ